MTASNLLTSFGMIFGFMPILALSAQTAPPGLEAFGYSILLSTADFGTSCGSGISASVTQSLGLGAGDGRSWHNLGTFVWICALVKFMPLLLLPLVVWSVAESKEGGTGNGAGAGEGGGGGGVAGGGGGDGVEDDSARLTHVSSDGGGDNNVGDGMGDDTTDEVLLFSMSSGGRGSGGGSSGGGGGGGGGGSGSGGARKYLLSDNAEA